MFHRHPDCNACSLVEWITALLLFLAALAAFIGVYETHFPASGATFTSPQGGIYLLAFAISATFWSKQMKKCCGCACTCRK